MLTTKSVTLGNIAVEIVFPSSEISSLILTQEFTPVTVVWLEETGPFDWLESLHFYIFQFWNNWVARRTNLLQNS